MLKHKFKHKLGAEAKDIITGFEGVIYSRTQWLHNCNTYGLQPKELKDGVPQKLTYFDEPQLKVIKAKVIKPKRDTGGPVREVPATNRE